MNVQGDQRANQQPKELMLVNESGQRLNKLDEIITGRVASAKDASSIDKVTRIKNSSIEKINRMIQKGNSRHDARHIISTERKQSKDGGNFSAKFSGPNTHVTSIKYSGRPLNQDI